MSLKCSNNDTHSSSTTHSREMLRISFGFFLRGSAKTSRTICRAPDLSGRFAGLLLNLAYIPIFKQTPKIRQTNTSRQIEKAYCPEPRNTIDSQDRGGRSSRTLRSSRELNRGPDQTRDTTTQRFSPRGGSGKELVWQDNSAESQ